MIEVLQSVRKEVGPDYPVFIKMHCSDDWGENGLQESESLTVAKLLQEHGITGIEFSGGNLDNDNFPNSGPIRRKIRDKDKQSYFAAKTARIAENLNVPVISVGGHRDVEVMANILSTTPIEYLSMSRLLHSEPDVVNRWQKGDNPKPRCVACNKCWDENGNICILDRKA